VTALVGRALALAAHPLCRARDPGRAGLVVAEVEAALTSAGIDIGGKTPRQVLGTALNNSQDLFGQAPGSRWVWIEPIAPRGEGLSGLALAEEAYPVAMRLDPSRQGIHYETLKLALLDDGVIIRGTNPGKTMFGSLQGASRWFEWVSSGKFRWKP
jgi:hypothetical protein